MKDPKVLLGAVVGPLAAAVIDREMGADLRRRVRQLEELGQLETARQLSTAAAQLRAAAAQVDPRARRGTGRRRAVALAAEDGAAGWLTSAEVASHLGITDRRVRVLVAEGRLAGLKVRGRWLYDPLSVAEEETRRAATPAVAG